MSGGARPEGEPGAPRFETRDRRSLFQLVKDLPGLIVALIKAELNQLKAELVRKAINAGIGLGLLLFAGLLLFFMLGTLVAAAVLGIAVALPAWAAALIVAGGLLVLAAIVIMIGVAVLKRGMPPMPTETIESVKQDVNAVKGLGDYDH